MGTAAISIISKERLAKLIERAQEHRLYKTLGFDDMGIIICLRLMEKVVEDRVYYRVYISQKLNYNWYRKKSQAY